MTDESILPCLRLMLLYLTVLASCQLQSSALLSIKKQNPKESHQPKETKTPLTFLTSENKTCAASRNQISVWFSYLICCFCPSVCALGSVPSSETKVAETQLCFQPQPLTARPSCQEPATAEMRCWRSETLQSAHFIDSWEGMGLIHISCTKVPLQWQFLTLPPRNSQSLSVSRILITWMSVFCSLTEVAPLKKTVQREEPSCTKGSVPFQ